MAAKNPDSLTNAQGEFHPRQPGSEPLEKSGVSLISIPQTHPRI